MRPEIDCDVSTADGSSCYHELSDLPGEQEQLKGNDVKMFKEGGRYFSSDPQRTT